MTNLDRLILKKWNKDILIYRKREKNIYNIFLKSLFTYSIFNPMILNLSVEIYKNIPTHTYTQTLK